MEYLNVKTLQKTMCESLRGVAMLRRKATDESVIATKNLRLRQVNRHGFDLSLTLDSRPIDRWTSIFALAPCVIILDPYKSPNKKH